jgi:hypothetical protein
VAALRSTDEHVGRGYTPTGPESVPIDVIAAHLSRVLARPMRAVDPAPKEELDGLDPWEREIYADLYERVRRGRFGLVTGDLLLRQPVIDATVVQDQLEATSANAHRAIRQLQEAGIITEFSGRKRRRLWQAAEVLSALDDFAVRATQRRARG